MLKLSIWNILQILFMYLLKLKRQKKKSLVTFLVAGDPDLDQSLDLMISMAESGVDVIELGVPVSDPEAEGPIIKKAHERALRKDIYSH